MWHPRRSHREKNGNGCGTGRRSCRRPCGCSPRRDSTTSRCRRSRPQAEFATGTLYNFFASKEDLFFELLEASAADALDLILPALDEPGDERQKLVPLHPVCTSGLSASIADAHPIVPAGEPGTLSARAESRGQEEGDSTKQVISRLSEVIAAGIRRGLFNEIDPVIAAKCLHATLESMMLAAVENPQAGDSGRGPEEGRGGVLQGAREIFERKT